ncbi:MAG: hypothetical protein QG594_1176, partial [Bacteroidota bacterium]|nr:hypothetical protein [Bacteroidota bacterium]
LYSACTRYYRKKQYYENIVNDRQIVDLEEQCHIVLCAPTGMASYIIRGVTCHVAFHLETRGNTLKPLAQATLERARKVLKDTKIIIIDEISMCGANMFSYIDERLKQITGNSSPFGGLTMILFGDLLQLPPVKDSMIFMNRNASTELNYSNIVNTQNENPLWQMFSIYRLTEIMRQQNDLRFAEALNVIGIYGLMGLSNEQVKLFDTRIIDEKDIPIDAIDLHFRNDDVEKFNYKRIFGVNTNQQQQQAPANSNTRAQSQQMNNEVFRNDARHKATGNENEIANRYMVQNRIFLIKYEAGNLPATIPLKKGIKYMIIANLDVQDGICNGTTALLRDFTIAVDVNEDIRFADTVWLDFNFDGKNPNVGRHKREGLAYNRLKEYIEQKHNIRVGDYWTPIQNEEAYVEKTTAMKWSIKRIQLPMVPAESITINKSQGQTLSKLAFDLKQVCLKDSHWYVALSRVSRLEDLYLYGANSIVQDKLFTKFSAAEKQKKMEEKQNSAVQRELRRMQKESPFNDKFPFTDLDFNKDNKNLFIVSHNCNRLAINLDNIRADYGFMNASVLLFSECHVKTDEHSIRQRLTSEFFKSGQSINNYYPQYNVLPNFTLMRLGSSRQADSAIGCAIYIKSNLISSDIFFDFTDNSPNQDGVYDGSNNNNNICELSKFEFVTYDNNNNRRYFIIFHVYNHPNSNLQNFYNAFVQMHRQARPNGPKDNDEIYILGDMNINLYSLKDGEKKIMDKLEKDWGIKPYYKKISSTDQRPRPTTDSGASCIDWCLTNNSNDKSKQLSLYESVYSDHKPMALFL